MLVAGRDLRVGQLDHEFFSEVDAKNVSLKLILPRSWWYICFIIYINDNVANSYNIAIPFWNRSHGFQGVRNGDQSLPIAT